MATNDVYTGNKASDYQPPTDNPQSASTNLQPVSSSSTNPTQSQDDVTQQRLPSVDNLKVIILQDGSGATNVHLTPVQAATQTWAGPFWGCVILGIVAFTIWSVKVLAKEEAPKLGEALQEAIHDPLIESVPVVTPKPKKKSAPKKPSLKKPAKKRSKKK